MMPVLNVGFVGTDEFARTLAKKGDSRDIDSYVHKETVGDETRVLSILRPLKHPDSIRIEAGIGRKWSSDITKADQTKYGGALLETSH